MHIVFEVDYPIQAGRHIPGHAVPLELEKAVAQRLDRVRLVAGEVMDASEISTWYPDAAGRLHVSPQHQGQPPLDCSFDASLVREGEGWREETPGDISERAWSALRDERDRRLAACDWTQLPDSPLNETTRASWAAYRQALRDVPQDHGDPAAITWPEPPEA